MSVSGAAAAAAAWRLPVGRGAASCYLRLPLVWVPCHSWWALAVPLAALAAAAAYYLLCLAARPGTAHAPAGRAAALARAMPRLRGRFWPTPWLWNGHLQTVWSVVAPSRAGVRYEREIVPVAALQEGRLPGRVAIDWAVPTRYLAADAPVVVVLHGLTGGARERYVKVMVDRVQRELGWRACGVNYRGCGGLDLETPQAFCASYTDDVRQMVRHVRGRYPRSRIYLVGYSLGANILVKYLGEEGARCPATAAVAFANPFDLAASDEQLHSSCVSRTVYSRKLASNLVRLARRWAHHFEGVDGIELDALKSVRSVRDFDEQYTRRTFGYDSVGDYYEDASSARVLGRVGVPLMCVSAEDDPVCPFHAVPRGTFESNPNLLLVSTRTGGHSMDWFEGLAAGSWAPGLACEFLAAADAAWARDRADLAVRVDSYAAAIDGAAAVLDERARLGRHVKDAVRQFPAAADEARLASRRIGEQADPFVARRRAATERIRRMREELERVSAAV